MFACKLKTGIGFLGREAVEQARAAGPRRLVSLVLPDADQDAMIGVASSCSATGPPSAR